MFTSLRSVSYKAHNLQKAKQWYSTILDKQPVLDSPQLVVFLIGDNYLTIIPGHNQSRQNSDSIYAYWNVDNIDAVHKTLLDAGASPHSEVQTIGHTKFIRVIDPFGNIIGVAGSNPESEDKTVVNEASTTAQNVAMCRALATYEKRPELKGPDHFAELFLPEKEIKLLQNPEKRKSIFSNIGISLLYGYMIARTAFIDSYFLQALKDNLPQIVILGAGYDTRTIRFKDNINNTTVFELDTPTTQNRKIDILQKADIIIPEQLSYIPINFEKEDLGPVLMNAGFDNSKKTLFIMEGVLYYLTAESADNIFSFINNNSPTGSISCFDYLNKEVNTIYKGEPFLFWIPENKLEEHMQQYNFNTVKHLAPMDIEKQYLTLSNGQVAEKALSTLGLVYAEIVKG